MTLAKPLDARLSAAASQAETRAAEALGGDTAKSIVRAAAVAVGTLVENGYPPVILTSAAPGGSQGPDAGRLAPPRGLEPGEIPRDTPIEVLGSVVEEEPAVVTHTTRRRRRPESNPGRAESTALHHVGGDDLMRAKTYRASTMKEALTRVRRDLGGGAVILSARECAGTGCSASIRGSSR